MADLIKRSLELDYLFLKIDIPLNLKLIFIYKKYFLLLRHSLSNVLIGVDNVNLFNNKYYYNDRFGISFLQSVYVDNTYLKKYIKQNSIIVDIGANIGQFNIFCKNYLKAKRVYSYEPIVESFSLLKKNVQDKGYVFNYAVGGKDKSAKFFIPDTNLMASSIKPDKYESTETVKMRNINNALKVKSIDLLKIDTEGSEYDVIKSSKKILRKSKFILVEVSLNRDADGSIVEIVNLLISIIPSIKVVEIGRIFVLDNEQNSVDILFKNEK